MVSPPRRLFLVAMVFLIAGAVLAAASIYIPAPGPLSEPTVRQKILRDAPQMVLAGGTETVVPFIKADRTAPTYAFTCVVQADSTVQRSLTYGLAQAPASTFGFFRRSGRWAYTLTAIRQDSLPETADLPRWATAQMCDRWRPALAHYLNVSSAGQHLGDQLEAMLTTPLERTSWLCWQNGLLLCAGLAGAAGSLAMLAAVLTLAVRLIRPILA